jgi:hypothetical protein
MWTVVKIDKKKLQLLKEDFKKYLGNSSEFYIPKMVIQKFVKNKLYQKEIEILGDYVFCYNINLTNKNTIDNLKFSRGLKYFLSGAHEFQKDINEFIQHCKSSENDKGFIIENLFEIKINSTYKFMTGPFVEKIFQIINYQKGKLRILIGNLHTTIEPKEHLFRPV